MIPYERKAESKYGYTVEVLVDKTLIVPDWFARTKYFYESRHHHRPYEKFDKRVLAIIGETEKAYNVILGHAKRLVPCWVAKVFVTVDENPSEGDFTMVTNYATAMKVAYVLSLQEEEKRKMEKSTTEERQQWEQQQETETEREQ